MIEQSTRFFTIASHGQGFYDFTRAVTDWVAELAAFEGLLTLHVKHTSCSLLIQENTDPDVHRDLLAAFARLAPRDARYYHDCEGPDDMPLIFERP